ncbi:PhzF family phenazine biosynthesis protein [Sorangium sp. So ce590]
MRTLPYRLCDVFTDRPFAGNPLAVFTEAAGLDSATMQVLAREMNLSESAFVLPPTSPETHARIRIRGRGACGRHCAWRIRARILVCT